MLEDTIAWKPTAWQLQTCAARRHGLEATPEGITGTGGSALRCAIWPAAGSQDQFPHLADLPARAGQSGFNDIGMVPDILRASSPCRTINTRASRGRHRPLRVPGVLDDMYTPTTGRWA